jgi:hypothetical protein
MLGRLLAFALTLIALSSPSLAAAPLCEVVFAPVRIHEAMRAVLAKSSAIVKPASRFDLSQEPSESLRFDPSAFESAWKDLLASARANPPRAIEPRANLAVSEWSPQLDLDSKILKIELTPRARRSTVRPLRVLITGGVHGNEPIGVITALDIAQAFLRTPDLAGRAVELTVLPALNFEGLSTNRRRLSNGSDLNRQFDSTLTRKEKVARIESAIGPAPFDLALDLHGSNERHQFFVIKQGPDTGLAGDAIQVLEPSLRLLSDEGKTTGGVGVHGVRGYESNRYQLEAPGISTSVNRGTLKSFMSERGTPYSYTLEYPGQLSLETARAKNLALALSMIRQAALRSGAEAVK